MGGLVETRNAVETVLLLLLLGYPELFVIPMPATIRIVVMVVTLLPLGVLSAMGIDGDSLFQFLGHICSFWLKRRKLHFKRVGYHYDPSQLKNPGKQPKAKPQPKPKQPAKKRKRRKKHRSRRR